MCHEDKPPEAFAFRSLATGERQDHCRECHAEYRRQHYLNNKPIYIENERVRVRGHRERNRELLRAYLLEHPCVDCGETDPVVLDFDHRDPSLKRLEVTKLAAKKPWLVVLEEILKCDVRCANCHRRRTAEQFSWRRAGWASVGAPALGVERPVLVPRLPDQLLLEMRECRTCRVIQPLSEFALKNKKTGKRSWKCKTCQRAYAKSHYAANRPNYLARSARRNGIERERIAAYISQYLNCHPCVDCGNQDLRILDFDHRDRSDKRGTINAFIRSFDWEGMIAEIAKCDVRCANCHRRRTARQLGWYRSQFSEDGVAA